jgi:hypothetical protein
MYFTSEGKINTFDLRIKASHWLKLSEIRCARTTAGAVAAERIIGDNFILLVGSSYSLYFYNK